MSISVQYRLDLHPWENARCKNLLVQTLDAFQCLWSSQDLWSSQESKSQSILEKHYKLHSLVTKRYWIWNKSLTHITMWFMFRSKWGTQRCQMKDYSVISKPFTSKWWFMRRYRKLFWTEYKGKCKYCNVLLKKSPEINRLGKHDYLFMQDGARVHTVKLTLGNV